MKGLMMLAVVVAACVVGCKKKDEAAPAGTAGSAATAPAPKTAEPAPAPSAGKTCEELGGTKEGDRCKLKTAPFEVTSTGKFDTDAYHQEPGPVFKVTNKSGQPMKITTVQLYAYDKAGEQVEMTFPDGSKGKNAQQSKMGLIELDAGQTKDFVASVPQKGMPADSSAQLEIQMWETADGKQVFVRDVSDFETRPKDGWK